MEEVLEKDTNSGETTENSPEKSESNDDNVINTKTCSAAEGSESNRTFTEISLSDNECETDKSDQQLSDSSEENCSQYDKHGDIIVAVSNEGDKTNESHTGAGCEAKITELEQPDSNVSGRYHENSELTNCDNVSSSVSSTQLYVDSVLSPKMNVNGDDEMTNTVEPSESSDGVSSKVVPSTDKSIPGSIASSAVSNQDQNVVLLTPKMNLNGDDKMTNAVEPSEASDGVASKVVPSTDKSIPGLRASSAVNNQVQNVVLPTQSEIINSQNVSEQKSCMKSESEDEDDALLSELESELQIDSDTSSQTTDIPPSDEDLSSRISYCSSELSLNMNSHGNNCHKVELQNDFNLENKHVNISRSSSSNSSHPDSYRNSEYHEIQMEALERTIVHLRQNVNHYKQRLRNENEAAKKAMEKNKTEYCAKIEKLNKMYDSARKEKESMVMKFANAEKEKLKVARFREDMERKVKEASRDREMFLGKMKQLTIERTHLNANLESKINDNRNLLRDNEKLKEEISSKDVKIKWAQNKLKSEVEAHKESQSKLEKVHQKLLETREESEQIRRDCQDMIRRYQESEEIKSVSLDKELKARTTELEKQRQQKSDQEEVCLNVKEELESVRHKSKNLTEENNSLTIKIQNLEKERLDYVQSVSKLKDQINIQKQEIVDMQAKLAEMDSISIQLEREKEKAANSQKEVERLRQTNADLQGDMDACHIKEGELLEFTQRITSKNVQLQSDLSCLESKQNTLEEDLNEVTQQNKELENQVSSMLKKLGEEKKLRQQETQILARKLAEKTKAWDQLTVQLGDANNENRVLKRRHLASVKELTRELQQSKKRIELYEFNNQAQNGSDRTSLNSRTNSNGSLDTITNNHLSGPINNQTPSVTFIGVKENSKSSSKAVSKNSKRKKGPDSPQENQVESILLPDRQMLIEKIVKLQKIHARKREKIEFLEEHISQLLTEIKRKSKIIQSYIMREEAGALVSNTMDENKVELSRRGGIMASVYHSHSLDGTMTLDLSLEINGKLQAVLEDTLLKNITLKENISTLGEEISRLTYKNKSSG